MPRVYCCFVTVTLSSTRVSFRPYRPPYPLPGWAWGCIVGWTVIASLSSLRRIDLVSAGRRLVLRRSTGVVDRRRRHVVHLVSIGVRRIVVVVTIGWRWVVGVGVRLGRLCVSGVDAGHHASANEALSSVSRASFKTAVVSAKR